MFAHRYWIFWKRTRANWQQSLAEVNAHLPQEASVNSSDTFSTFHGKFKFRRMAKYIYESSVNDLYSNNCSLCVVFNYNAIQWLASPIHNWTEHIKCSKWKTIITIIIIFFFISPDCNFTQKNDTWLCPYAMHFMAHEVIIQVSDIHMNWSIAQHIAFIVASGYFIRHQRCCWRRQHNDRKFLYSTHTNRWGEKKNEWNEQKKIIRASWRQEKTVGRQKRIINCCGVLCAKLVRVVDDITILNAAHNTCQGSKHH